MFDRRDVNEGANVSEKASPVECGCACHADAAVLHPVPCCVPCRGCGLEVPNGIAHACRGSLAPSAAWAAHRTRLVHGLTRYDSLFAVSMALLVMGLAVFSVPWPGFLLLLGAAGIGGILAFVWLRRPRPTAASVTRGERPEPK